MKCRNTNASRAREKQPPELFYKGIKVGVLKTLQYLQKIPCVGVSS